MSDNLPVLFGTIHRVTDRRCLSCHVELDDHVAFGSPHDPLPGDVTICAYCHHLMAFDATLGLRQLSDAELKALAGDRTILRVLSTPPAPKPEIKAT